MAVATSTTFFGASQVIHNLICNLCLLLEHYVLVKSCHNKALRTIRRHNNKHENVEKDQATFMLWQTKSGKFSSSCFSSKIVVSHFTCIKLVEKQHRMHFLKLAKLNKQFLNIFTENHILRFLFQRMKFYPKIFKMFKFLLN